MNSLEFLILITNGMFALYRWIDIRENRHARKIQKESQKLQRDFNEKVTGILEELKPGG